jgi:hypothetical protein
VLDTVEKNKLFADMVPAAEVIHGAVGGMRLHLLKQNTVGNGKIAGMVVAAEQAITIVDEEYKGQIIKTTDDLKDAGQQLVNSAYLPIIYSTLFSPSLKYYRLKFKFFLLILKIRLLFNC